MDMNGASSTYVDDRCQWEHNPTSDSVEALVDPINQASGFPTGDNKYYYNCQGREEYVAGGWPHLTVRGFFQTYDPPISGRYVTVYMSNPGYNADALYIGELEVYGTKTQCWDCRGKSTSPAGSTSHSQCSCDPGHYGAWCSGCGAGKYKSTSGSVECALCPIGKYTAFWY